MGKCMSKPKPGKAGSVARSGANNNPGFDHSRVGSRTLPAVPNPDPEPEIVEEHMICRALFDYGGTMDEDLPFVKGDILEILKAGDASNPEWWFARHKNTGAEGYIPSNYVAEAQNVIENADWFYDINKREDAERILLPPGHARGTFMVRKSSDKGQYALSIRTERDDGRGDTVKHYKIRFNPARKSYFVAEKRQFATLAELVSHYKRSADGLCCKLAMACSKERPAVIFRELEIDRSNIELKVKVGAGMFGEVWKGKWRCLEVAVKTLKEGSVQEVDSFVQEARVMHQLRHRNLIQLYAVCLTDGPIWIISEFMDKGALREALIADKGKVFKFTGLINFMAQTAAGLKYCEAKHVVHRDIRASNILIDSRNTIKIADFGLARNIASADPDVEVEYTASQDTKFPVKWTAPEAAWDRRFTIKSDVWSFGVLIYEIVTYGRMPYPAYNGHQVLQQLEQGYRMPKPEGFECPDSLYQIQLQCWNKLPEARPTFEYLAGFFDDYFVNAEPNYAD